jgi:hypothetical protein
MNEAHTTELRNFFKTALLLMTPFLVVLTAIILIALASHNPDAYARSIIMKEQLLHDTPGARVIIMGGSGAASSIDSSTLKSALHKEPVNMGLFAGVGMRFIVNEVRNNIHKGDIILLAPEYEMLQQPSYGDGFLLLQLLEENPSKIKDVFTLHGVIVMTRSFPSWLQFQGAYLVHTIHNRLFAHTLTTSEKIYTLDNITRSGDLDTSSAADVHLSEKDLRDTSDGFVRPAIDPTNLSLITSLAVRAKNADAQLFVVLPAVPVLAEVSNLPAIKAQYTELIAALGQDHILGTPGYFVFPNTEFLDAIGHLTAAGKIRRTDLILQALKEHLRVAH